MATISAQSERGAASRVEVAERVREDIRRGRYNPRERLVEEELAERYGVKRSAVRLALLELAAEGLVERQPNRGARVRSLSLDEIIEITETRLRLLAMCAAKAAARVTDDVRADLEADLVALREAADADDLTAFVETNVRIFSRVRATSGHATANRIIDRLSNHVVPQVFPLMVADRRSDSLRETELIVRAVLEGDGPTAHQRTIDYMNRVVTALEHDRDRIPG